MTIKTLQDRIERAEDRITKKRNTIEKKRGWIEKKRKAIETGKLTGQEAEWTKSDIEYYEDDIQRLEKEISETEKMISKYKDQLAGIEDRERIFLSEVPEDFKRIQEELISRWDAYDMEYRDLLHKEYHRMVYRDFYTKYGYNAIAFSRKTDKEIHEANVKDSKGYVIGLYFRIRDITGKVTDWHDVRFNGVALNGIIIGEAGRVKVETIEAGGYNIQRLHVRTLVHSI